MRPSVLRYTVPAKTREESRLERAFDSSCEMPRPRSLCTVDEKRPDGCRRNRAYCADIPTKGEPAPLVTPADKVHNPRVVIADYHELDHALAQVPDVGML